ncbi:MAG: helix-turn-helix domain-containing protein [Deltaproteobacteria bacterium]|nr:MAG: helix-turn-helix domain-containing protein [Deltaproteobacteria bacterium]
MSEDLLTTRDAARLLGVSPSTVKRWAEQGLLACEYTAGGHRRFRRAAIRALMSAADRGAAIGTEGPHGVNDLGESDLAHWLEILLTAIDPSAIEGALRAARDAHGAWWRVADRVGALLTALGHAWASGEISVLEEHLASERLRRALLRCADDFTPAPSARRAVLATAAGEDHDLGLVLCELTLREAGWTVLWSGRRSPVDALDAYIRGGGVDLVAVSASSYATDTFGLARELEALGDACAAAGAALVVGGTGLWPDPPPRGVARLHSFAELAEWVRSESDGALPLLRA